MTFIKDPLSVYGEIMTVVIYVATFLAFAWLVRSQFKEKKALIPESKKVNSKGHDLFESKLDEIKRRRDSRTKMDFTTTANGTYKDPRTQQAFAQFNAAPAHERSSDNFLLSLMVGCATGSSLLGYAAGGGLLGGLIGAGMHHDSKSKSDSDSAEYDYGHKEKVSPFFGSTPSNSDDSCRASDYSYSSSSSDSSSGSSYSSSDSGSSSSDSGSSSSSSSE